ncbi:hypothetical protein HGRIS_008594 [Hohenbuehelia grisea]|uniref:Ricin B lectin domain-containing protein n=1 Tax=Hohenbuehelia grisea TaxID=104357 RepID=A0ABR3J8P7_9AGAR
MYFSCALVTLGVASAVAAIPGIAKRDPPSDGTRTRAPGPVVVVTATETATATATEVVVVGPDDPSPPPPPPSGGGTEIHPNGNDDKCLDVEGNVQANGTPVQIYDCNGTGAQQWVINTGDTKVQLAGTNFCLDAGSEPGNAVRMKIWTCYDNLPAQAWRYDEATRQIVLTQDLPEQQCLDLEEGDLENGQVQTYRCGVGNLNQVWTL